NATGHFVMNGGSTVLAVIDTPGRGYTSQPTVSVANTTGCSTTPTVTAYYTPNGQFWLGPNGLVYQIHQADTAAAIWSIFPTPSLPLDSIVNGITAATVTG